MGRPSAVRAIVFLANGLNRAPSVRWWHYYNCACVVLLHFIPNGSSCGLHATRRKTVWPKRNLLLLLACFCMAEILNEAEEIVRTIEDNGSTTIGRNDLKIRDQVS
jgi:hypothetical protein